MAIRGLAWGMGPAEVKVCFEGPELSDLGVGNLSAARVPIGPYSASILLGFFDDGLRNIRLIVDQSSFGSMCLSDALDLIVENLSEKYGLAAVKKLPAERGQDWSTASQIEFIRSLLSKRQNGSITWQWRAADTVIAFQYLGTWGWESNSESITLLYERAPKLTHEAATLKAQLSSDFL